MGPKLEKQFYVHPSHTWVKVLKRTEVKIGIDDIVAIGLH